MAAAFACVYAIVVKCLVYRSMKLPDIVDVANQCAGTIAVLLLVATSTALTYYLTLGQGPQQAAQLLTDSSPREVQLLINVGFLFAGMFIDPSSTTIVLTPLIFQAALAAGLDPVSLGALIVANVSLGMVPPSFGLNLFVDITNLPPRLSRGGQGRAAVHRSAAARPGADHLRSGRGVVATGGSCRQGAA